MNIVLTMLTLIQTATNIVEQIYMNQIYISRQIDKKPLHTINICQKLFKYSEVAQHYKVEKGVITNIMCWSFAYTVVWI